jgi:hypothetical protein
MREVTVPDTLHDLLDFLLPFAQAMLAERESFLPFGAGLTADRTVAATPSLTDHPLGSAETILAKLFTALQRQASSGDIQAAGICTNVIVTLRGAQRPTHAICLELEDRSGEAVEIIVPYVRGSDASPEFKDALVTAVEPSLFVRRGD